MNSNSMNDNPVIDHENHNIFHGGNFHGDDGFAWNGQTQSGDHQVVGMLSERQLNYSQRKTEPEISAIR